MGIYFVNEKLYFEKTEYTIKYCFVSLENQASIPESFER